MDLVTPGLGLIFWQALTFIIVLVVLSKVAWKPILNTLKEREETIESALKAADAARSEMQALQANNEKLLQEARIERDRVLREAETTATAIVIEAKDKANEEATRLLENARLAINNEKAAALADIKNYVASLSIEMAEKVLRKELADASAQKSLVEGYLRDMDKKN
ncbi:F-type H+-transporting ATPase subunit b [Flexibacter flexilis DSM 6793]|uniref:ATP synthase subunit b n=1 Tax=Flexibacter flexilis DSM 6793 TaxID=927664 RepID=A0A1I1H6J4_9BACT|nr:F0F1 ATP synthase subunit B [Flexibacter flexilis]SFC17043.1 F-type H+-transporting ATPase subunit b [Flexibacter flexilis DSM 6793]